MSSDLTARRRPAVFLDRDGVLNVLLRGDYVKRPDELALVPGAGAGVQRLNALGLPVFVISNQQGVAKGLMSPADLQGVDAVLRERLVAEMPGARLDASYYCPHGAADECDCRKPRPGLLLRAAREHDLDLARSFFVGDAPTDALAARAAGVGHFILVLSGTFTDPDEAAQSGRFPVAPDFVAPDLPAAARFIAEAIAASG